MRAVQSATTGATSSARCMTTSRSMSEYASPNPSDADPTTIAPAMRRSVCNSASRPSSAACRCSGVKNSGVCPSLAVVIEAAPGLAAQVPCRNHLAQQWAGPVLRVAEAAMQHFERVQYHVQPDEVGQRQRAHRVIHAELHHRVDRLCRTDRSEERRVGKEW